MDLMLDLTLDLMMTMTLGETNASLVLSPWMILMVNEDDGVVVIQPIFSTNYPLSQHHTTSASPWLAFVSS